MKPSEPNETERTLLVMLASAVIEMQGLVECNGLVLGEVTPDKKTEYFISRKDEEKARTYPTAKSCVLAFLDDLRKRKVSWNNIVFYPDKHDDTGTTWRFLKIDMSFLRIVLSGHVGALSEIVKRLATIMFAREEETRDKGNPERN